MQCVCCQKETSNPKFCSRSCAGKVNNVLYPKRIKQDKPAKQTKPRRIPDGKELICSDCTRVFYYNRKRGHTERRCNSCLTRERRRRLKKELVLEYGGCCTMCGYSANICALSFHHKDAKTKLFHIASGYGRTLEELKKEAAKCVLLCMNCHSAHHYEMH